MAKYNPNMANREVAELVFYNYTTKKPFLNMDFANVTTTGLTADRVFAKGGQGSPNRVPFDGNAGGTLKVETQVTPMKLYQMLSGSDMTATATWLKREVLTSATKALTLTDTPVTGSVYVYADGDDCGTEIAITVTGSTATLTTANDGVFIVYYLTNKTNTKTIKFTSKAFPKTYIVYGKCPWKTEEDEIAIMNLTYYKACPQRNFEIAYSSTGDPTTLSVTFDLFSNDDGDIYDMSIDDSEA
jgi:hypothetical protein